MAFTVYWTPESASRTHEVDFFPEFVNEMRAIFSERGYNGVLLGWPKTSRDPLFLPDVLIITENVVLIVDFKKAGIDGEIITLSEESSWESTSWTVSPVLQTTNSLPRSILAGNSVNPFVQLKRQTAKLRDVLASKSFPIKTCVVIQGDPHIAGKIPAQWEAFFKVSRRSEFSPIIDSLLNTKYGDGPIDFESLRLKFDVVPYREIANFIAPISAGLYELQQTVDEQARALHSAQTEIRKLHQKADSNSARKSEVRTRIEDISREEALLLRRYEAASNQFIAAREAERERYKSEAERHKAEAEKHKALQSRSESQPSRQNRKVALKYIGAFVSIVVAIAGVAIWSATRPQSQPAAIECQTVSSAVLELDEWACVKFTPLSVGFSNDGNDAYLNDVETNHTNGYFVVSVPDYLKLFGSRESIQGLVNQSVTVSGPLEKTSDGRFKITLKNLEQLK
jgi:hypothetical protein